MENLLAMHRRNYITGGKLTVADFCMASFQANFVMNTRFPIHRLLKETLEETPRFNEYLNRVLNVNQVYLSKRPARSF